MKQSVIKTEPIPDQQQWEGAGYIKNRIFKLALPELSQAEINKLPASFQKLLQQGQERCLQDIEFCKAIAGVSKTAFRKILNQYEFQVPVVKAQYKADFEKIRLGLQYAAQKQLLTRLYPQRYLRLLEQIADIIKQQAPAFFKSTSLISIKKQVINNFSALQPENLVLTEEDEGDDVTLKTRTVWVVVVNVYFAYRNKLIRDTVIQLLAKYLSNRKLISQEQLISFFQIDRLSSNLLRTIKPRLKADLINIFPRWKGIQITRYLLQNQLRQVRNLVCKALPDTSIWQAAQKLLDSSLQQEFAKDIRQHFEKKATKAKKMVDQYLVGLLMRKINTLIKLYTQQIWEQYFFIQPKPETPANIKGKIKVKPKVRKRFYARYKSKKFQTKTKSPPANGLPKFIYEYLATWLEKHPGDKKLPAHDLWQRLQTSTKERLRFTEHIKQAKPIWLALLQQQKQTGKPDLDLNQFIRESIPVVVENMVGKTPVSISVQHKVKIFRAFHRATPLRSFTFPTSGKPGKQELKPALSELLQTRFERQAETSLRPALVKQLLPEIEQILKEPEPKIFVNADPVFKSVGFALDIADNRMYELDLQNKQLFISFTTNPRVTIRLHIQDQLSQHARKREKQSRLDSFASPHWKALSPKLVYQHKYKQWLVHIPFEQQKQKQEMIPIASDPDLDISKEKVKDKNKKVIIPPIVSEQAQVKEKETLIDPMKIQTDKSLLEEIVIGLDQGIGTFGVVSVMHTRSRYEILDSDVSSTSKNSDVATTQKQKHQKKKTKTTLVRTIASPIPIPIPTQNQTETDIQTDTNYNQPLAQVQVQQPELVFQQELAKYYIGDIEALDVKFDPATGLFRNGKRQTKEGRFQKRKGSSTRGKGKLRYLQQQIRRIQAQRNQVMESNPENYATDPVYITLSKHLSTLWDQFHNILDTIAKSTAAKVKDIAVYFNTVFKDENPQYKLCQVRVQVEDLRWSRPSSRSVAGAYLAQNQILFFHRQIQQQLGHALKEQNIGLWRVNPYRSSQTCALCGYYAKYQRNGKVFHCKRLEHRIANNKVYKCNADLNAARNIALWPPLTINAINS